MGLTIRSVPRRAADQLGHLGALLGLEVSNLFQSPGESDGVHQVFLY